MNSTVLRTASGAWLRKVMTSFRSSGARKADGYEYQPAVADISYEAASDLIEESGRVVVRSGVDASNPAVVGHTLNLLAQRDIAVEPYAIDLAEFARYRALAQYAERYPRYYGVQTTEKHLEHFVTLDLLKLSPRDVFVDIASEDSPVPDIFERLAGASTYWQDIQYEPGIKGRRIGGDACHLPVPKGFATAVALTCSLEHFEGDADQLLCEELGRILRPGGSLVIAPLYLYPEAVIQTDPVYSAQVDVQFDPGVPIYCAKDWRNRHGRFYSPETLQERILDRLAPHFTCCVKVMRNYAAIQDQTYLRFALFCTRH
jgi:hypothetical protein